jgi:hypothetical protein
MFTAHADLKTRAEHEPTIDGSVLKTDSLNLIVKWFGGSWYLSGVVP